MPALLLTFWLKQAWILSDPHHHQELAQAMTQTLGDFALRQQLTQAGREAAATRTWTQTALEYEKLFSS